MDNGEPTPKPPRLPKVVPGTAFRHFTQWLQDSGQWRKFTTCRAGYEKKLRKNNHTDPLLSLAETAQHLAAQEFGWKRNWRPPFVEVSPEDAEKIKSAPDEKLIVLETAKIDYEADVAEAYRKMEIPGLVKKDFDSQGAYSYWKLCNNDKSFKKQFLKDIAPKALGKVDADTEDEIQQDALAKIKNLDMFERISREVQAR
jgi:hypothetical protein